MRYSISNNIYDILIESALIFLIIFTPLAFGTVQPWSIMVLELTAVFMAAVWMLKITSQGELCFVRTPFNLAIFLFIFLVFLQWLSPKFLPITQNLLPITIYKYATKSELFKILSYAMIFFVVINNIRNRRQLNRIITALIITAFLIAVFGIIQNFTNKTEKIYWIKSLTRGGSPFGSFVNRDHFAGYIGMIISLSMGMILALRGHKFISAKQIFFVFCLIIMASSLFLSLSRGGVVSFLGAISFMAILFISRRSTRKSSLVIPIIIIFIFLSLLWLGINPVINRLSSLFMLGEETAFAGRLPVWKATLGIVREYPIFGTGLGTFGYIFPKYNPIEIKDRFIHTHNDYLQLLSEMGIIGLVIVFLAGVMFMIITLRIFYARNNPYNISLTAGCLGSIVSIFLHSFVDFNLHIPANAFLFSLIVTLTLVAAHLKMQGNSEGILLSEKAFRLTKFTKSIFYPTLIIALIGVSTIIIKPVIANHYFHLARRNNPQDSSIAILKKAIAFDPGNAEYHYHLGRLYSKAATGTVPEGGSNRDCPRMGLSLNLALAEYQKAVQLNPTNSKYHQSLAWTYGNLGRQKEAIEEFQKAIELEPNNPYRYKAFAIFCLSQYKNSPVKNTSLLLISISAYRRAIELEPKLISDVKSFSPILKEIYFKINE